MNLRRKVSSEDKPALPPALSRTGGENRVTRASWKDGRKGEKMECSQKTGQKGLFCTWQCLQCEINMYPQAGSATVPF